MFEGSIPPGRGTVEGDICLALLAQWTRPDLAPGVFCRQDRSPHTILLLLHPFNGLFSRTTWVSWYHQKGKTSLDLNEARDDGVLGRQWHQLDHMQTICTSLQTDNHTNTSSLSFYRPDALKVIPDVCSTVLQ